MPSTQVVKKIEKAIECSRGAYKVANKISSKGCTSNLKNTTKPKIVIDLDPKSAPERDGEKKADFLFVGKIRESNLEWIAVLELKSRSYDAKIIKQLQAGARAAENLIPNNFRATFRAVAVVGGPYTGSPQNWHDDKNKIEFRGKKIAIHLARCGSNLKEELLKSAKHIK